MSEELKKLIEATKDTQMSPSELEEQRRSFAYGNANIENEFVTKEAIALAAEQLRNEK